MLLKAFISILFLLPLTVSAQRADEELINWSKNKKLTWADYKGNPDPASDAAASTTTYLSIEYKISTDEFGFMIESRFSKSRSWGRHKTDYILSHEQGHFDIAEFFARKLYKEMKTYRFNNRTYQKDLKRIYDNILEEKEAMQNDYDRETRHSINKEKQEEWLKKIAEMLEDTNEYADYQNKPYSSPSTFLMISPRSSSFSANLFWSTSITNSFPSLYPPIHLL